MSRAYQINGESLVRVYGGAHCSGISSGAELGLSVDNLQVVPRFVHKDIPVDDFGPNIPANVMWNLADVRISMNLINYDPDILDQCVSESMGGMQTATPFSITRPSNIPNVGPSFFSVFAGTIAPAGTLLANGMSLRASGNRLMAVQIDSPQLGMPWRFVAGYLAEEPLILPLGVQATVARLNWRMIPYQPTNFPTGSGLNGFMEIISSGAVLWDHLSG